MYIIKLCIHYTLASIASFDIIKKRLIVPTQSMKLKGRKMQQNGDTYGASSVNVFLRCGKGAKFFKDLSVETNSFCREAGFIPNIVLEINDPAYVRDYIEMGFGIGFIPSYSWKDLFTDNIVLRSVGKTRKNYAYIPKNKYIKRITKEFLKELSKEAKKIIS